MTSAILKYRSSRKLPLVHPLGEVAVRRRDDSHVDADLGIASERLDLAPLDGAQELGLERDGQLGDLVEESVPESAARRAPTRAGPLR